MDSIAEVHAHLEPVLRRFGTIVCTAQRLSIALKDGRTLYVVYDGTDYVAVLKYPYNQQRIFDKPIAGKYAKHDLCRFIDKYPDPP